MVSCVEIRLEKGGTQMVRERGIRKAINLSLVGYLDLESLLWTRCPRLPTAAATAK